MIGDPCGTSESIYTGKGVFIYKMPAHHSKLVLQMGVLFFLWLCVATLVRCQCDSGGLGGVSNSFLFVFNDTSFLPPARLFTLLLPILALLKRMSRRTATVQVTQMLQLLSVLSVLLRHRTLVLELCLMTFS